MLTCTSKTYSVGCLVGLRVGGREGVAVGLVVGTLHDQHRAAFKSGIRVL